MKQRKLIKGLLLCCCLVLVIGCGRKGPLYIPPPPEQIWEVDK